MSDAIINAGEPAPTKPLLDILLDGDRIAAMLVRQRMKEAQRQYIMWAFHPGPKPALELSLFPECPDIPVLRFFPKNYHLPVEG